MTNTPQRVGVIGAGPAGLAAAYQLIREGISVDLFEAGPSVGGMARTITLWGQQVDIGPHRFFSADSRVNRLWLEVVGSDYEMVTRRTRIFYKGQYYSYPLEAGEALRGLGVAEATRCAVSYLRQQGRRNSTDASFEDWVVRRFGRRLFQIFFQSYSEKLWGISCQELDADFAAQRIKKFSLWEAIRNALGGSNTHPTLVDQFAYPHGGTGMVYDRLAQAVESDGGQVFCSRAISRVLIDRGKVTGIETEDGEQFPYDHIISTMPLTHLIAGLPNVPMAVQEAAQSLRFRNTIIVYLQIEATDLFPDQWLYIHAEDLKMGRLTNFRNWVPQLYGTEKSSILALEYWCYDTDPIWTESDESLIAQARSELRSTGLIGTAKISAGKALRIPRCYPVYRIGYQRYLEPVQNYLNTLAGLSVIGRYGAFKYNNQDHSLLMGILAAENIAEGASHDLWSVNTDYEYYQEASVITDTGLVKITEVAE